MTAPFDFVVVGSGAGSMCAALVLRAAGKSVLILEKTNFAGGTTAASGGVMWIPDNRFMQAEAIADSREQALAYLDAVVGDRPDMPGASRARRQAFVENASRMIDFLVTQGIRLRRLPSWPDHYDAPGASKAGRAVVSELFDIKQLGEWAAKLRPGFLPLPANLDEAMLLPQVKRSKAAKKVLLRILGRAIADKLTGRKRATAGQALQAQLMHAAIKAGTEIRLGTTVKELLVESGRVTGVLAGGEKIEARLGVLINAGGFAQNQSMRDQHLPLTSTKWTLVPEQDTGDLIVEAQRIGAAVAQMDQRLGYQVAVLPNGKVATLQGDMSKPHAIVVDQGGARYQNESGATVDFCRGMLERNKTYPALPSWLVVDSQFIGKYMLAGSMPGAKKPQAWFDSKFLRRADTLEQLGKDCGMDPGKLKASVERFNGFARTGRDTDFKRGASFYDQWLGDAEHKPSPSLGTVEQAPFYALQVFPGDVSTFGGIVTDAQARVLRSDGSIIPGLYATGTSTASVMGPVEAGGGGSIGPTLTWAYLAAQHALSTRS
jgi:3-oxosteroid 1-dehydrogenase